MSKKFSVSSQKTLAVVSPKKFSVTEHYSLDFSSCSVRSYPSDKVSFSAVIETLSALSKASRHEDLQSKGWHKIVSKGIGKSSEYIQSLIRKYGTVNSLDVFHRNGKNGNIRLLYAPSYDNAFLLQILDCYIDDH